jgi:hypothetical protein
LASHKIATNFIRNFQLVTGNLHSATVPEMCKEFRRSIICSEKTQALCRRARWSMGLYPVRDDEATPRIGADQATLVEARSITPGAARHAKPGDGTKAALDRAQSERRAGYDYVCVLGGNFGSPSRPPSRSRRMREPVGRCQSR